MENQNASFDIAEENGNNNVKAKQYKISVVIPCYNQEKYIDSCLKSLQDQHFDGLEIIMVDDGSTDLTKKKIEEYKAKNPEMDIFYYYQENAGPGVARNTALNNAHGEYIAFLDSDDKLPAGAYNALYYTAEKYSSDIVIGEYLRRIDNKPWYVLDYIRHYCKEHEGENCAGDYIVAIKNPSLWNRLFRRDFLENNNIRFMPEMHGEDLVFNLDTVRYAKKIYTTQSIVYCYTKRTNAKDSVSTSWTMRSASSRLRTAKAYSTFFDNNEDVLVEYVYLSTTLEYFLVGFNTITDSELQRELFEMLKKEILVLYKGKVRYEKLIEVLMGVSLDVVLEIPYKAYKILLQKVQQKAQPVLPATAAKAPPVGDPKIQVLQQFKDGKVGLRYVWRYFKAWLKFKLKIKK